MKVILKGPYDDYIVLEAVNQSLRAPAADIILTMGPEITADAILAKLKTRFGSVMTVDALTEKLYQLKQGESDISTWAFNLEEVLYEIEEKGGITHTEVESRLKTRFWHGLSDSRIKEATRSDYPSKSFDELLMMCRTLHEEYATKQTIAASVKQQSSLEKKMDLLIDGFNDMKKRVGRLEASQKSLESGSATTRTESTQIQKHDTESKDKKTAYCTKCRQQGHLWFGCKKDDPSVKCNRCDMPGHLKKCCRVHLNI